MSWSSVMGATAYDIQVSTSYDFSADIFVDREESGTTATVLGLDLETTYYWRVAATDGSNAGMWSVPWSFTTYDEWSVPGFNGKNPIEVYPVPVGNTLTIQLYDSNPGGNVKLYNLQGQMLLQQDLSGEFTEMNTSDLSHGTYILRYENESFSYSLKITK